MPPVPRVLISPSNMPDCPTLSPGDFATSESQRRRKHSEEDKRKELTNIPSSLSINPAPVCFSSSYCHRPNAEISSDSAFKRYPPYNIQSTHRRRSSSGASQENLIRSKLPKNVGISIYQRLTYYSIDEYYTLPKYTRKICELILKTELLIAVLKLLLNFAFTFVTLYILFQKLKFLFFLAICCKILNNECKRHCTQIFLLYYLVFCFITNQYVFFLCF